MRRKIVITFLFVGLAILSLIATHRALPYMKEDESYNSIFPRDKFLALIEQAPPDWMQAQIDEDFGQVFEITSEAVEETYRTLWDRIGPDICHYRVIDNKLYKYIPNRDEYTHHDTRFEKAFKTLLSHIQVPNLDFLLCPMDGIPEPYMPPGFYKSENQAPLLGNAKIKGTHPIILIPDKFSLSDKWLLTTQEILHLNPKIVWEDKANKAFWRGALTDTGLPDWVDADPSHSPRYQLTLLAKSFPQMIDAAITGEKGTPFRGATKEEHLQYKYLPALDGHMCTYPGYQWRLLSNCLTFKQSSDQIQWFYRAIHPYQHYIPIQNDLTDLIEKIEWAKKNDEAVQKIGAESQFFAKNNLLMEHNYLYLWLTFIQYGKLQIINFNKLKQNMDKDPNWHCIQYRNNMRFFKKWGNPKNYSELSVKK